MMNELEKYDNEVAYSYDEYLEEYEEYYEDDLYEELMIEREENMKRKVIYLKDIDNEDFNDLLALGFLNNYVWKDDKLIPAEMIEGE